MMNNRNIKNFNNFNRILKYVSIYQIVIKINFF